jgi:hypothetical protein
VLCVCVCVWFKVLPYRVLPILMPVPAVCACALVPSLYVWVVGGGWVSEWICVFVCVRERGVHTRTCMYHALTHALSRTNPVCPGNTLTAAVVVEAVMRVLEEEHGDAESEAQHESGNGASAVVCGQSRRVFLTGPTSKVLSARTFYPHLLPTP